MLLVKDLTCVSFAHFFASSKTILANKIQEK